MSNDRQDNFGGKMPANEALALNSNFETWCNNRFPDPHKRSKAWEYYCADQFARPFDLSDSQLKTGLIDGGGDGGIDAFYILANGELVDSETELSPKDPPSFKLLIMQIKSNEGFSPTSIDKIYWFIDDLLDLSRRKADYHSTYHDDLIALMRLFKDKFGLVVGETPLLEIQFVYVIKKDVEPNEDCLKSANKVEQRCKYYFNQAQVDFKFANATGVWMQVQSRPPKKKTLKWASQSMETEEGHIGLVKLTDFYNFIATSDEKIEERFFDSNVRGYWPSSNINRGIAETLKEPSSPEFWLLNNGVTILTDNIGLSSKFLEIEIHDPQIVNGLQTSRQIFNHFNTGGNSGETRRVLVRVIKTTDTKTRDEVIRCTNSQNEMPQEALRATDAIHRQIEQSFHTKKLYYDRRKGHYRDQGKPVDRIVSVVEVLQAMLSIVLQRPDEARGRPRDYVKNDAKYKTVFGENKYSLTLYLTAAEICRRVDDFLRSKGIESIHRRNIFFYLTMYVTGELIGSAYPVLDKIQQIDVTKISDSLLESAYTRVWKKYDSLATKFTSDDGEKGYDLIARGHGQHLLKGLLSDLKRRFNKNKKK
jgi:hypothetical protein